MAYADLHCHTAYSDGIHTIVEVAKFQKEKGVSVVAIADHDTIFHYNEIKETFSKYGLQTVRAVEMSCYDFDVFKKVHIVGLWLNDNPVHVEKLCNETLKARDNYHKKLIELLQEKGFNITYQDAKKYAPYNIVFKMHLFMALCEKYPEMANPKKYREMFASKTSKETDAQMGYIDIKEGIKAIQQDGGIAILAHPCEYNNYDEIEKYVSYGLNGIEISHPLMKEKDYQLVNQYVSKFNLFASGGSDFHTMLLQPEYLGNYGLSKEQFETLKMQHDSLSSE